MLEQITKSANSVDQSNNLMHSYSSIISPQEYNSLMTNEHLYISTADMYMFKVIEKLAKEKRLNVVEIGCGPARITQNIAKIANIELTAIDIDPVFIEYAKDILYPINKDVKVICGDVTTFKSNKSIDIVYSQGFHHHISKGKETLDYLANIYSQLSEGGIYILSDEFVPNYTSNEDRNIKLVIWYAHVIAHAARNGYMFLAREEAKTFLDDIQEGSEEQGIKSEEQIKLVLEHVQEIDQAAKRHDMVGANAYAKDFLMKLQKLFNLKLNGDMTIDLSRHDYKICDRIMREEVEGVGFAVESCKSFGPVDNIGGMSVYILRK